MCAVMCVGHFFSCVHLLEVDNSVHVGVWVWVDESYAWALPTPSGLFGVFLWAGRGLNLWRCAFEVNHSVWGAEAYARAPNPRVFRCFCGLEGRSTCGGLLS
jgi:hypothetical protein